MPEKYSSDEVCISALDEKHLPLLSRFKCDSDELNDYLRNDAIAYQRLHLGMTYLLLPKSEDRVISYLALATGSLRVTDTKEFKLQGRPLREYPKIFPHQFPALLVGKLATDKSEEGRGGAGFLLDHAVGVALGIRKSAGCTHLVVHAKTNERTIGWYTRKGFLPCAEIAKDRETVPLYLELP